ncbi:SDR family NAD(P)-dependent oxidoreductase [Tumebacillus lipolyticus]|uniref:SDR family NAD(P)-dependent oxidoreductase n=1 Tax=Tumebacillus lipolyticus TaxID=1280370 RepID=A0ABW4ZTH5_9BACL
MRSEKRSYQDIFEQIQKQQITPEEGWKLFAAARLDQQGQRADQDEDQLLYFQSEWVAAEPIRREVKPSESAQTLLLFAHSEEIRLSVRERLGRDVQVVLVQQGKSFEQRSDHQYVIDPASAEAYRTLFKEVKPDLVLHLWSQLSADDLQSQMEQGILALFHLSRACLEQKLDKEVQLLFAHPTAARSNTAFALQSAVSGFARTLRLEHPQLVCKAVELDLTTADWIDHLLAEANASPDGDVEIRYEGGQRFCKRLQEAAPLPTAASGTLLRERGVYLISGGAGGLGLLFAELLARQCQAKLVLTGRSAADDQIAKRLKMLEALGADVLYLRGDVTSREDVDRWVGEAKARFGEVHGVIHSAGVIRDSLLLNKTAEDWAQVIAPKVFGTVNLDLATQSEPLDFFVLFSSLASAIGNIGQSDYAYANCFMDRYAEVRANRRSPGRTLSFNWPLWQAGGMQVSPSVEQSLRATLGLVPLQTENGWSAFAAGLAGSCSQLVVTAGDASSIRQAFEWKSPTPVTREAEHAELSPVHEQELRALTEAFLKELFAGELELTAARLQSQEPLENYGLDSVMIMTLTRELEKQFGTLSKTLFFEYQTISELAGYLQKHHGEQLLRELGVQKRLPSAALDRKSTPQLRNSSTRNLAPRNLSRATRLVEGEQSAVALATDEIAIIGLSGRYPQARTLDQFWENLRSGRDCITEVPAERWDHRDYFDPDKGRKGKTYSKWGGFLDDVDKFDPLFFNISPREAELLDPQERLFLQTVWHLFEDANYTRPRLKELNVGVFVGVMWGQYQLYQGESDGQVIVPNSSYASIANRVSYTFNLNGPSLALDTMCSSSLTAIHLACDSLRKGESKLAVAGGVNLTIHPNKYLQLAQGKFASSDGRCRAFGEGGDGYVPGEGVGAVLLKPLAQAKADGDRIYAVIKATAVNHGGKTNGYTVPNPNAQGELIAEVLKRANLDPQTISYIEAHGTGTSLGDPIEITGLQKAFGEEQERQYCAIGSVKSNIGHLESAAGIAGLTKVLLQMKHGQLVPSLHAEPENPHIPFAETPFYVQRELSEWKRLKRAESGREVEVPRRAGISSFGAGGSNAHLIVEEYLQERQVEVEAERGPHLLVLSAKREERLRESAAALARFLAQNNELSLAALAQTLQVGREEMEARIAFVASDLEQAIRLLEQFSREPDNCHEVFRGNLKGNRSNSALVVQDEEGSEYFRRLVQNRKLSTIAQLWVDGLEIDWSLLQERPILPRLSLPGYPFAEERYWVEPRATGRAERVQTIALHPLIDTNESTLEEQCFQKRFHADDFYLRDHLLQGNPVLPGVVYLELARAAGEFARRNHSVIKLTGNVWLHPLTLREDAREMHISLYPQAGGVAYEVTTRQSESAVTIHAQGTLVYAELSDQPAQADRVNLADVQMRNRSTISVEQFYQGLAGKGLQYGRSMRPVQQLWGGENEALARLEVPAELQHSFDEYGLHPILLDGMLQTISLLTGPYDYLPFALQEIELFHPLTSVCYALVCPADQQTEQGAPVRTFDLRLLDPSGRLLLAMRGLSLRGGKQSQPVLQEGALQAAATAEQELIACYRSIWKPERLSTEPKRTVELSEGPLLLFDQDDRASASWAATCGRTVVTVVPGNSFARLAADRYVIDLTCEQDYRQLLQSVTDDHQPPCAIVHRFRRGVGSDEQVSFSREIEAGIDSLFLLSQALQQHPDRHPLPLLFVYPLGTTEQTVEAIDTAVGSFAKTWHQEQPRFLCKTVGIADSIAEHEAIDALWQELCMGGSEPEVRYQSGERLVHRLEEEILTAEVDNLPLKERGVYLITGGLGGLGLIFADYLASQHRARLVLSGRSERGAEQEQQLRRLSDLGADVHYVQADVSQKRDVDRLIEQVKAKFGVLHGVIHSAGVLRDSLLLRKQKQDFDAVVAPKLYGTIYLDEATKREPLDFFVLFSSLAAVLGNVGQSDYATGNRFMDEYVKLRAASDRPGRSLSLNWPYWQAGGMRLPEARIESLRQSFGVEPLETACGLRVFERLLAGSQSQSMVLQGDRAKVRRYLKESGLLDQRQASESAAEADRTPSVSRVDRSLLREGTTELIKEVLSNGLKLRASEIEMLEPLENYGIDSVMIVELTQALELQFGELSKTLFFEYQTADALTDYFLDQHAARLVEILDLPTVAPAVERSLPAVPEIPAPVRRDEVARSRFLTAPAVSSPSAATQPDEIAIIGISGRFPKANSIEEFWDNLKSGRDCVTEVPEDRWDYRDFYDPDKEQAGKTNSKWGGFLDDVDKFDPLFFNIAPSEAELLDPQERLFLETVWETLENAGYTKERLSHADIGVYVGVMYGHYQLFGAEESQRGNVTALSSSFASIANRVSYFFNWHGPSIALDTMCSSSLTAIHLACESLHRGESEMAVAGGVNVTIHPNKYILLSSSQFMSSDGRCRSFGEGGDGYVPGEGVGAVLLKPLKKALADGDHIHAVIKGTAVNHGGKTNGYTVPNPVAQTGVIAKAIKRANLDPRTISYIEAHGTGTSLGDPIEITGLMKAFAEHTPDRQFCAIGSAKSNIGHLESAAGVAGIAKVILQMKHRQLVPSLHSEQLNPHISFVNSPFYVQRELQEWKAPVLVQDGVEVSHPRRAGVSSFGAGGANAHILLEEFVQAPVNERASRSEQVIILSAKNAERLNEYVRKMISHLEQQREEQRAISALAYTLQTGREEMSERVAFVVSEIPELIDLMGRFLQGERELERVYQGNVRSNKEKFERMIEGRAGREFLRMIMQDRQMGKIAQFWVSGISIDWELLHEGAKAPRMTLPTYPFAKERYWAVQSAASGDLTLRGGAVQRLHPLIERNTSTVRALKYSTRLVGDEYYLAKHLLFAPMLPGAMFLEVARAAGELAGERAVHRLEQVVWSRPMSPLKLPCELQIQLYPADTMMRFEVSTESEGEPRTIHCQGTILLTAAGETPGEMARVDVQDLIRRATVRLSGAEWYRRWFGDEQRVPAQFHTIQEWFAGDGYSVARLEIPSAHRADAAAYGLHALLADGALQAAWGLPEQETALGNILLPQEVERFDLLGAAGASCYVRVIGTGASAHLQLLDEAGHTVASMQGCKQRAVLS